MSLISIYGLGSVGLATDPAPGEAPLQGFTAAKNVRFSDGKLKRIKGLGAVYGKPLFAPNWLLPVVAPDLTFLWLYAGLDGAGTTSGTTHSNVTRASGGYSGVEGSRWNGGSLGGIPVINNGVDIPQMWNPVSAAQRLQNLTNWPSATTCKVLRPFGNFLVALDVIKLGVRYPLMVKWSSAADPGTVPGTWDPSDPTREAGEFQVGGAGELIDCLPLKGVNVIYQDTGARLMQIVGGVRVFDFGKDMLIGSGLMAPDCVIPVLKGTKHFVVTLDDIGLFDGQNFESVASGKIRRSFYKTIDPLVFRRSFVVMNRAKEEVWVCIPQIGDKYPSAAFVWDVVSGAWSFREFPQSPFGAVEVRDPALVGVWDDVTLPWDSMEGVWDDATAAGSLASRTLLLVRKPNSVSNGAFTDATGWTLGTDWSVSGSLATKAAGATTAISQAMPVLVAGRHYEVRVAVSGVTAGSLTPMIGSAGGTVINASGIARRVITAAGSGVLSLAFLADAAFAGSIDDVEVRETGFLRDDETVQIDGVDPVVLAERTSIPLTGQDEQRNRKAAFDDVMLMREVWLSATGSPFKVSVGGQDIEGGPIVWSLPFSFDPEVNRKVDPAVSGRFLGLRFEDAGEGPWEVSKVGVVVESVGRY